MRLGQFNQRGAMLIVVLWVLVFLMLLALGLGRRGNVNNALIRLMAGQTRAQYLALSAVRYAAALIEIDTKDVKGSQMDTLYQCGFVLPNGLTHEKLFRHVQVPGGYFDIVSSFQSEEHSRRLGMSDEESRINLNAISAANHQVLKFLIMDAGFKEDAAITVASSVVDWVDQDDVVSNEPYGHENGPVVSSEAHVKNGPFENLQELLLVKGMTPEMFAAIKDELTVFPRTNGLTVNLDTATPRALRALARSVTGNRTNTEVSDADALVEKILRFRRGPDGVDGTDDDRAVVNLELSLNSRENALMAQMEVYRTKVSSYLRMGIRAVDEDSESEYLVEAVIARSDGKVVDWQTVSKAYWDLPSVGSDE